MAETLNLNDPAFLTNRYANYRALRASTPVMVTENNGEAAVVLTRYADVDAILREPRATVQPAAGEFPAYIGEGPAALFYRLSLPHMDPPEHTRVRRVLTPAFHPQAIARMESWVAQIIEARLEAVTGEGAFDVVPTLAATIPADVACRLLHVPLEDAPILMSRVMDLTMILSQHHLTDAGRSAADAAARFYFDYFGAHLDARGELAEDDFLDVLIRTERAGQLNRDELIVALIGVFMASYHTTMVSLTNAVSALGLYPEQRAALAADPTLAARAWEEVLRFDGPIHFVHRYPSEPLAIGGYEAQPGSRILLGLAAANRDEAVFDEPEVFDISRPPVRHLSFAGGGHFCLGSQLSRLEGRIFLNGFLARFPHFRLSDLPSPRIDDLAFPHAKSLSIEIGRSA